VARKPGDDAVGFDVTEEDEAEVGDVGVGDLAVGDDARGIAEALIAAEEVGCGEGLLAALEGFGGGFDALGAIDPDVALLEDGRDERGRRIDAPKGEGLAGLASFRGSVKTTVTARPDCNGDGPQVEVRRRRQ